MFENFTEINKIGKGSQLKLNSMVFKAKSDQFNYDDSEWYCLKVIFLSASMVEDKFMDVIFSNEKQNRMIKGVFDKEVTK